MRTRKQAENFMKTKKTLGYIMMVISALLLIGLYLLSTLYGGFGALMASSGLGKITFILIVIFAALGTILLYFGGLFLVINHDVKKPEYRKRPHTKNI